MNLKQWLKYNPYRKLWSLIGGRKWTFIIRDVWHQAAYFMQAFWFYLGVTSFVLVNNFISPDSHDFNLWTVLKIMTIPWGIYTLGYLNGHFFFGKKYQKGQRE